MSEQSADDCKFKIYRRVNFDAMGPYSRLTLIAAMSNVVELGRKHGLEVRERDPDQLRVEVIHGGVIIGALRKATRPTDSTAIRGAIGRSA